MNEMRAAILFYKDLVLEKERQIERMSNELKKVKKLNEKLNDKFNDKIQDKKTTITHNTINTINGIISSPVNNNLTKSSMNISTGFKLDFKNKLIDKGGELCSERTSQNSSIINRALNGGVNIKRDTSSNSKKSDTNCSTAYLVKGKKINTTYSNFFRKSNLNNGINNTTNKSGKSFFGHNTKKEDSESESN